MLPIKTKTMNVTFNHYPQSDNDFAVWGIHGGVVTPMTLVLDDEEALNVENIMADGGFFWTEQEAEDALESGVLDENGRFAFEIEE